MSDREEQIEVLDALGHKTGQVLPKSVVHSRSLRHQGVHVWIYNSKGEVLLQQRALHKEISPGVWDVSAGGHVEVGETPETAILRELREELGISTEPVALEYIGTTPANDPMHGGQWYHRSLDATYLLKLDVDIAAFSFDDGEVSAVAWVPLDEFVADIAAPAKRDREYSKRDTYVYDFAATEIRRRTRP